MSMISRIFPMFFLIFGMRSTIQRLLRSDFLRHGILVFMSTIVVNAFNYVFHVVISRKLGVVDYGVLYSLFAVMAFLGAPTSILMMIVARYAAEFHALGDGAHLRALSSWALRRTGVLGVLVILLGGLFASPIATMLRIQDDRSVFLASVVFALSIVLPSVFGILQGVEDFKRLAISSILEGSLKAVLGIFFVFMGFGVNGALLGFALSGVVGLIYTWIVIRRRFAPSAEPLHLNVRRLMKTSAGITAAATAMTALGFSDVLLVKHYFLPREAGLYSATSLVGKVLFFLVGFIPTIVLPKVTARVSAGKSPVPIIVQAGICIAGICGSGLFMLFLVPGLAIRVMSGDAFLAAAPLVFPYACAMTFLAVSGAVVAYKMGLHCFDFVPALFAVVLGEIVAISFLHRSLSQVVWVLVVGHALAMSATLYRIGDANLAIRPEVHEG
jgi:O-antigen/teichoic acid export membrane protein